MRGQRPGRGENAPRREIGKGRAEIGARAWLGWAQAAQLDAQSTRTDVAARPPSSWPSARASTSRWPCP
eukprot:1199918-Pleurochrysis_carterae.AAC.3